MVTVQNVPFSKIGEFVEQYPKRLINDNILTNNLIPNSECIFVNRTLQKQFIGVFHKIIEPIDNNVNFKITIQKEVEYDKKLISYKGWNILPEADFIYKIKEIQKTSNKNKSIQFLPPFFDEIQTTKDWRRFEELSFYLLKCIGISEIIKVDPTRAAGKYDGFFKYRNLAVIYDSTLNENFQLDKDIQIKNYCDRLRDGIIDSVDKSITFYDSRKAIWIITQGKNKLIKTINNIRIKEITVEKLCELYLERLLKNFSEEELEEQLFNL